ncbi:MAG: hypothetical protein KDH88_15825 [Chromatiales bacterium]|nr:hypothetical protein [Chromatiales bacterium]
MALESVNAGDVLEPPLVFGRERIVKVREIEEPHTLSFDEAKPHVEAFLLRQRRKKVLDDWFLHARESSDIRYFPQAGKGQ